MNKQQEKFNEIRKVFGTKEPSPHDIPRWFLKKIQSIYPQRRSQREIEWWLPCFSFMDHWGTIKEKGKDLFVCEPYGPTIEQMNEALAFSFDLRIKMWYSCESWWYPGHTFRIVFEDFETDEDIEDYFQYRKRPECVELISNMQIPKF